MKKRVGEPWMPPAEYGRSLPTLTVDMIVREVDRSVLFYKSVLEALVRYADPDFAALRLGRTEVMLHADHAYEANPWAPGSCCQSAWAGGDRRGVTLLTILVAGALTMGTVVLGPHMHSLVPGYRRVGRWLPLR